MAYGIRTGVLGSDKAGKIKGAKGPSKPSEVTLPPIKKASKKHKVNSVNV